MKIERPSIAAVTALLLCGVATTAIAQDQRTYTYDALGRLIEQVSNGAPNNNEVHSICYDAAGNRTQYRTSTDGSSGNCDPGIPGTTPTPSPTPTPTPTPTPSPTPTPTGNNPPVTVNDSTSGNCYTLKFVNLTANDSDPEQNYPLNLTAITQNSGLATASIASASSVVVEFGPQWDSSSFTYTVQDSLGASSTGHLAVTTSGCGLDPL